MKKRRDITLGEMQDECKKHDGKRCIANGSCAVIECAMKENCVYYNEDSFSFLDLTDPPRFNEQQMAFFRGLRGLGVVKLDTCVRNGQPTAFDASGNIFYYEFLDNVEFPLDLAELLGKDGKE